MRDTVSSSENKKYKRKSGTENTKVTSGGWLRSVEGRRDGAEQGLPHAAYV